MGAQSIAITSTTMGFLNIIIALVVLWVVTSVPLYLASKVIIHNRSSFWYAMRGTFIGAIVFLFFGSLFGLIFPILGLFFGFIGILLVLMGVYQIDLVRAFLLAFVTFIVYLILSFLLALLGVSLAFTQLHLL